MRRCARGAERGWTMKMEDGGSRMRWMEDGGWNRVLARPALARTGAALGCMGAKGSHERSRAGWQMGASGWMPSLCRGRSIDRSNPSRMHACSLDEFACKTREEAAY